ncbi:NAD(P)/FAD-dependent oxidoreductase [Mangrovihabitans endophyticus]|uniref:FAD-binding protein n=1 Tax=Mangrovihabitans endophyticus TaxID=1751298 RepID=A0A8J3FNX8_9ACTN|nr:NAD(P)/FAD-dependent oxidoreductase [Mangrovihabitans endophyticus]GGK85010.1 FAD-binding protein [Mangrovihabitans endophyticus]
MAKRVLVIGGGPGGSTAAALLAKHGQQVQLLERETFPRYKVGESLASACRVVLELSGAVAKVDAQGFPDKTGALLRWGQEEDWAIDWQALFGSNVASWQVEREDFDAILLDHAAETGVDVRQNATVREVHFGDDGRPYAATWVDGASGETHRSEFDVVIDASGRAGVLSQQHFGLRRHHEIFRNVALWGYWQGGSLLPGTPSGGLDVISHPDGWYWVIPLRKDRYSVGFVTHKTNLVERRPAHSSLEEMLLSIVNESESVRGLLSEGSFCGKARVDQDYSYVADRFCGDGYYFVGDAACFLDPLLATGVHLALYSGMLAATAILAEDRGEVEPAEATAFYETLYRNAYARLLVLVSGVYEQYKGKDSYFWLAQRMVREQSDSADPSKAAFVEIVAGFSDLRDASSPGGTTPMTGLLAEAQRAVDRVNATAPRGASSLASLRIDPSDLHDKATGLYLVTKPELGIRRGRPA